MPAGVQPAMQPEAVVASLETAHDANRLAQLLLGLFPLARDQREQAVGVAAVQPVLADLALLVRVWLQGALRVSPMSLPRGKRRLERPTRIKGL